MNKKIITVLLSGAVAMTVLTGCGKKEDNTAVPTPKATATQTTVTETPVQTPAVTGSASEAKVTLGQYKGLTLHEVDSEVIQKELHDMMQEYAELVVVERAAKEGDTVNINFVGKKDGVAFEGGTDDSEEGTDLTLGSQLFIEGFEEGLIGAVAGEVRELELTFPEEYGNEDLNGQAVVFTVTVNAVKESMTPELTDEFAAENLPVDTVDGYVSALRETRNAESFKEQILTALAENSTVENYPADVIENEKQYFKNSYLEYAEVLKSYFGMDDTTALQAMGFESMEMLESKAEEFAYTTVKRLLILIEIARVENLTFSDEEYQKKALEYAVQNGYEDVASFEAEYGQDNVLEALLVDYVMDYILSQSTIIKAEK